MKNKKLKQDISNFAGLEYLTITDVPIIENVHGIFIDIDPLIVEKMAAIVVLENELPIRGRELKIIRGALDLSLAKFARNFDKDAATILKWEKEPLRRIDLANELLIRIFASEKLGVRMKELRWSSIQRIAHRESESISISFKSVS